MGYVYERIAFLANEFIIPNHTPGLSRKAIFNAVEGSLERLNTSYIDVLQIHRFDPTVSPKETMRALDDLVRAGMVHYIGASSMWAYEFAMLQTVAKENGWTQFISMQNHYNLIYREEEREMIPYCRLTGVGLIPVIPSYEPVPFDLKSETPVLMFGFFWQWAPLASGILARDPTAFSTASKRAGTGKLGSIYDTGEDDTPDKIIMRVKEVATKRGWPMSHVGLAWLNKRVTAPILGFSSEERILEALSARGKVLSDEEEQYLEELYRPRAIQGHS